MALRRRRKERPYKRRLEYIGQCTETWTSLVPKYVQKRGHSLTLTEIAVDVREMITNDL